MELDEVENNGAVESARDITARALADLAGDDGGGGGGEGTSAAALDEGAAAGGAEQEPGRARDDQGRFAPKKDQVNEKSATRGKAPPSRATAAGTAGAAAPGKVIPPVAAPAAPVSGQEAAPAPKWLKPAIREKWGTMDREVRDEFLRLNGDAARARQEAASAATGAQGYQEIQRRIQPFEAQIRAQGIEPAQYIGDMLGTVHKLSYGPSHVKADTLADVVMQFAPELLRPDMRDAQGNPSCPLDRALASRFERRQGQQAGPQPGAQPQQFRDPRLDQILAQQAQRQQAATQQLEMESESRAESFSKNHEFFEDVRGDVADILELWGKQGKREVSDEDFERAYDLACRTNADVAPLYEQRRAVQAAAAARQTTQRRRAASSSIRSTPGTAAQNADRPLTPREVTEKAARDLAGRA